MEILKKIIEVAMALAMVAAFATVNANITLSLQLFFGTIFLYLGYISSLREDVE